MIKNVYKDSFDSIIFYAKQSHNTKSSIPIEFVFATSEDLIPLSLCVDEKQPQKALWRWKGPSFL